MGHENLDAQDPGRQAPLDGVEDGGQTQGQDRDTTRAAHLLRSPHPPRWQGPTGRTVRWNPTQTAEDGGRHRPPTDRGHLSAQGTDQALSVKLSRGMAMTRNFDP